MENPSDEEAVASQRRDQMLKLVTRGFFNELVNYGVRREEIVRVASHLLDNVMAQQDRARQRGPQAPSTSPSSGGPSAQRVPLTLAAVVDEWNELSRLSVDGVALSPLDAGAAGQILAWLQAPGAQGSFVSAYPDSEPDLRRYFERPQQSYFGIHHQGQLVGMIGGENIDSASGKLEMKKLVGESRLQGQGIGKRATFAFLYYAFMILGMHKVYIHSRDINVRNISLNSGFGFEVEGVFLEDVRVGARRADVVRMALLRPIWTALFEEPASR